MTYLITVRRDESHTYDRAIEARSAWAAGWLYRQLNPGARIVAIRPAQKHGGDDRLTAAANQPPPLHKTYPWE